MKRLAETTQRSMINSVTILIGLQYDKANPLLVYAMAQNVVVITNSIAAAAAGILLSFFLGRFSSPCFSTGTLLLSNPY